jgi:hypothetical protein
MKKIGVQPLNRAFGQLTKEFETYFLRISRRGNDILRHRRYREEIRDTI